MKSIPNIIRVVLIATCLVAASVPAAAETALPEAGRALDEAMPEIMRAHSVPGVSIAVMHDGRTLYWNGGFADVERRSPVNSDTVFSIGSASKAFTALLAVTLAAEGRFNLDERLDAMLPGFRAGVDGPARVLTLRDALSHRSGLERADMAWYANPCLSSDDLMERAAALQPAIPFRSGFLYNNIIYSAAGFAIARRVGESWDELIEKRIFRPLNMSRSTTSVAALAHLGNVATPYERIDGGVQPVAWRRLDAVAPAGAINSSVRDMSAWVMLNLGLRSFRERRLAPSHVIEDMQQPQVHAPDAVSLDIIAPGSTLLAYGLGWRLHDYRGRRVVDHTGGIDGFSAQVTLLPESGTGIVTLTNRGDSWAPTIIKYFILDQLFGDGGWDEADLVAAEAQARLASTPRHETSATGSIPDGLSGRYTHPLYSNLTIEGSEALWGGCTRGTVFGLGGDQIRVDWRYRLLGSSVVSLRRTEDGRVPQLDVHGLESETVGFVRAD